MPPPPPSPPAPEPPLPIPILRIRVDDLAHPGADIFFNSLRPLKALTDAVAASFKWLYTPSTVPTNVEVVLLVLRPMPGVAHTHGSSTHKEIHLSLDYVAKVGAEPNRDVAGEILGVLTHEMVHCFQYNAKGTCPGGLIEGIADFVRLREELAPPHWRKAGGDKWDAGYSTTAYFLDWMDRRYGEGTVREINADFKDAEYDPAVFQTVTGRSVEKLWKIYCATLEAGTPAA